MNVDLIKQPKFNQHLGVSAGGLRVNICGFEGLRVGGSKGRGFEGLRV